MPPAGDRQLHLTLPSAYVPLWHTLGEEARHREAADAARAAAAARAREREAAAVKRQFERKPQSVVMSDSMQRLVQALLADAAGAGASGKSGPRHFNGSGIAVGSNAGMSTQNGAIVSGSGADAALQQAEEQLGAMGFSPQQVNCIIQSTLESQSTAGLVCILLDVSSSALLSPRQEERAASSNTPAQLIDHA